MFKPEEPELSSKFKAFAKIKVVEGFKCLDQVMLPSTHMIDFENFCENLEIKHQITFLYTPHQNGTSEWINKSIMEMLKGLLYEKGLYKRS